MPKQQPLCGGVCKRTPKHLWVYSTVILLFFGFFKELKPSEAFLNPYLTHQRPEGKNFSQSSVNDDVYPFWTYSYLVSAFFVFLLTDFMRYNPVILIETVSYLMTRILLIWGSSLLAMQLMQLIYGVATATEVGYYTYIYSAVPVKHYALVTGLVRGFVLLGRSVSSYAGQGLFSSDVLNYYGLNYFSLVSVCIATAFALLLPWYFSCACVTQGRNRASIQDEEGRMIVPYISCRDALWNKIVDQFIEFRRFYFTPSLLKWSVWWAFAMCGMLQVGNYVQSLWSVVVEEYPDQPFNVYKNLHELNGIVEGTTDLLGAFAAIGASLLRINWQVWGELTMGVLSLFQTLLLLTASHTKIILVAYCNHILYRASYAFMITIASSQLAISQTHESYGLIFGFNTFMALVLQTILTIIVNTWLGLETRIQFVVYGCYYYGLTVIFLFAGVYKLGYTGIITSFKQCRRQPDSPNRQSSIRDTIVMYVTEDSSSSSDSSGEEEDVQVDSSRVRELRPRAS